MSTQLRHRAHVPTRPMWLTRAHLWYVLPIFCIPLYLLLFVYDAPNAWQTPLGDDRYVRGTVHDSDEALEPFRWTEPKARLQVPAIFNGTQQLVLGLRSGRDASTPISVRIDSEGTKSIFLVTQAPRTYYLLTRTNVALDNIDVTISAPELREKRDLYNNVVRKYGLMISYLHVVPTSGGVAWWKLTAVLFLLQCGLVFVAAQFLFKSARVTSIATAIWLPLQLKMLSGIAYEQRAGLVALLMCGAIVVFAACFYVARPFAMRGWAWLGVGGYIPYAPQMRAGYARLRQHMWLRDDIVIKTWTRADWLIAAGLACGAVLARIPLLSSMSGLLNGDDYLTGAFAVNLLHGYQSLYYGHHTGTLASYLLASMLWLFGTSTLTMLLLPLILTAVMVVTLYGLAYDLTTRWGGIVAAGWMLFPSATAMYWTMKPQPGYFEAITCTALTLWLTLRLFKGDPSTRVAMLLMSASALTGVGAIWSNFVTISILLVCVGIIFVARDRLTQLPVIGYILFIGIGLLLWLAPLLIYVYLRPGDNPFWYAFVAPHPQADITGSIEGFIIYLVPLLFGVTRPYNTPPFPTLVAYMLAIPFISGLLIIMCQALYWHSQKAMLVLIVTVLPILLFVSSRFGTLFSDVRYVLPLYIAMPLIIAFFVQALLQLSLRPIGQRLSVGQDARGNKRAITRAGAASAVCVCVLLLVANGISTLRLMPPHFAMPERREATLARALHQQGIRYAYASYWISMGLMFESDGTIVTTSILGPSRTEYDMRNEQRVFAARGRNTAFVFQSHSVAEAPFQYYLRSTNAHCQNNIIAKYSVYYNCTPPPDVYTLLTIMPETSAE